ncbi:DUF6894 family protein [Bradyrhizobium cenepequi]
MTTDDIGHELVSVDEARSEAAKVLGEIAKDIPQGTFRSYNLR